MTTTTYSVPQKLTAAPLVRVRQRLARVRDEWLERRALERAAAVAGPVEWARMSGDFHRV
jgi:hypothetical protein